MTPLQMPLPPPVCHHARKIRTVMMWGRRPLEGRETVITTKATFPRKMSLRNTESWVVILVVCL